MKGIQQLMAEARGVVTGLSAAEAVALLGEEDVVFVDVRETQELAQGKIPGALHAPRGFLEFIADPGAPPHNPALASGKRLVLYCGSGARSLLAGKTLSEMGLANLWNLEGGIQAWAQAGGPLER